MKTLTTTLIRNNSKLDSDRNKRKIELLATKLAKNILHKGTTSFSTNFVANKIIKSKKKLTKKTKSK